MCRLPAWCHQGLGAGGGSCWPCVSLKEGQDPAVIPEPWNPTLGSHHQGQLCPPAWLEGSGTRLCAHLLPQEGWDGAGQRILGPCCTKSQPCLIPIPHYPCPTPSLPQELLWRIP